MLGEDVGLFEERSVSGAGCRELGEGKFLNLDFLLCIMELFCPERMETLNVNDLALF